MILCAWLKSGNAFKNEWENSDDRNYFDMRWKTERILHHIIIVDEV